MNSNFKGVSTSLTSIITFYVFCVYSYMDRHQVQLFGRGHIGGIDIKVNFQECTNGNYMFM